LSEKKSAKKQRKDEPKGGTAAAAMNNAPRGPMDVEFLQQIVKVMSANDLSTVDLRDGDRRVVLKRGAQVIATATPAVAYPAPSSAPMTPAAGPSPSGSGTSTAPAAGDETAGLVPIKSPMVGTFYAKPSPDAKPFVTVGSHVDEDTDVCVIEAMKVFNNIKAEARGTIAKVLVSDGQTVEFGTVLFLVKP
jgi:acetyl-CoA carboxylase biotin carboxyl carrier protein